MPAHVRVSLKKIKGIGYAGVELASIDVLGGRDQERCSPTPALVCCSSHDDCGTMLSDPPAIIRHLQALGRTRSACPGPSVKLDTADDVKRFAERLSACGKAMAEAGQTLSYHNHSQEFRRRDTGSSSSISSTTRAIPCCVQGQIDCYWVQHGGGDSEDWCRKLEGRLPTLHLKDYGMTEERQPTFFEIGYGNLTWKPIIAAADAAGCEWYIEQDRCAVGSVRVAQGRLRVFALTTAASECIAHGEVGAAAGGGAARPGQHRRARGCRREPPAEEPSRHGQRAATAPGQPALLPVPREADGAVTSGEHYGAVLNLDFDYRRSTSTTLQRDGLNLTRTFSGAYTSRCRRLVQHRARTRWPPAAAGRSSAPGRAATRPATRDGGNKFDLSRWDEAYFARLKDFVRAGRPADIVVEVNLFCPFYEDDRSGSSAR